jgi:hypothetical protein
MSSDTALALIISVVKKAVLYLTSQKGFVNGFVKKWGGIRGIAFTSDTLIQAS